MSWPINETSKSIQKEFVFANFKEALAFVNQVGGLAEKAGHHPDILLHDYKKVTITLTTHDEGSVTNKDYSLAESIDQLL